MLALRAYDSNDEDGELETETVTSEDEVKTAEFDNFTSTQLSVNSSMNLQICSAPEVIPTVSMINICYKYIYK